MKKTLIIICLCVLSACSTTSSVEKKYPDRVKYEFSNPGTWEKSTYLCENSDTEKATQKRAEAAHLYIDQRSKEIGDEATENLINSKKGALSSSIQFTKEVNAGGKLMANEIEEKFQCLLLFRK